MPAAALVVVQLAAEPEHPVQVYDVGAPVHDAVSTTFVLIAGVALLALTVQAGRAEATGCQSATTDAGRLVAAPLRATTV